MIHNYMQTLTIFFVWGLFFGGGMIFAADCDQVAGVNILLMDNSRSVPVTDDASSRLPVLNLLGDVLKDYENRLVLFGGRYEIELDEPGRFVNDGMHTDFFFAFEAALRIRDEYPPQCNVKVILITDGLLDAFVSDYPEHKLNDKSQAMRFSIDQTFKILEEKPVETYVILLGRRYDRDFIEQLSIHANGFLQANPLVERAAEFLGNNGFLLKQFIFEIEENPEPEEIQAVVAQIVEEDAPRFEWILVAVFALLVMIFFVIYFRSFPSAGDREIIDLVEGVPVLIGAGVKNPAVIANSKHFQRKRGLQHVTTMSQAIANLSYQQRPFDFSARGLQGLEDLNPILRSLLEEDVGTLGRRLVEMERAGKDDEIIAATDLKYYCSNLDAAQVKEILKAREMDRRNIEAIDFLHAKVYVAVAPDMLEEFKELKILLNIPSQKIAGAEIQKNKNYRMKSYTVRFLEINRDDKYYARVVLEYLKVPSLLGLKRLLPSGIQKILRFRQPVQSIFTDQF